VPGREQYLRREQHCRDMAKAVTSDGERRLLLNLANIWHQMANDVRKGRDAFTGPARGWSTDANHLLRQNGLQSLQPVALPSDTQDSLKT
jgi:hypothetical protein